MKLPSGLLVLSSTRGSWAFVVVQGRVMSNRQRIPAFWRWILNYAIDDLVIELRARGYKAEFEERE